MDAFIRPLDQPQVASTETIDDVIRPLSEAVTILRPHSQHFGDHDRWERESEQTDEVTLAIGGEGTLPQLAPDRFDARRQRVDRRGTKAVLQHLALTAMIGIIGRAQHSAHLMKDAGSITVLPQTGIGDHRQHVLVSTHDEERRIEGLLTMDRTLLEKVMMTDRWFEIVRVFEVRIGHRMSTSEGSVALIASTARPWAAMSPDTASVRPMSTVRM